MSQAKNLSIYLFIGIVAIILRIADLGKFVTIDEAKFWIPRSEAFLRALQSGDFSMMPTVGHPGVTTMWLGSAGMFLRRLLFEYGLLHNETYPVLLTLYRLPSALVHSIGIVLGYWLLRRMFSTMTAFIAALFWATDPFVIAYSRVLHVDGLTGTFATLSLLSACAFWNHTSQTKWLIFSGIMTGLAILSKLPGLVLLPVVLLLAVEKLHTTSFQRAVLFPLIIWGMACMATIVLLFPTIWANPAAVYRALRFGVESEGGQPHMWGNFFLGQPVETPGLGFYPVTFVLRTTPWTLAGVLLFIVAQSAKRKAQSVRAVEQSSVLPFIIFIILFMIGLSIFPKKLNRYLMPAFPTLDILAAIGFVWLIQAIPIGRKNLLLVTIVLAALINSLWYHPYSVTYANQLLGGARAGAQAFLTGWGEGFDEVATWLNQQPDIKHVQTVTSLQSVLNPYLIKGAFANAEDRGNVPDGAGYVVVYLSHAQRGLLPPYRQFYDHEIPMHRVTLHGIDYAWIYHVPQTMDYPVKANFGSLLQMNGYNLDTSTSQESGVITLTIQWQARTPIAADYQLFVHVFDSHGQQVSQIDVPLVDVHGGSNNDTPLPTHAWKLGRYVLWSHQIPVPAQVLTKRYWVSVGVYHPHTFARLPVQSPIVPQAPDDGPGALFLPPIR